MGLDEIPLQAHFLSLAEGRRLAWYEFGDARGTPCIYVTGTPTSGIVGAFYHRAACDAGVRWIALDKPGYGQSDAQPGRSLLDWAEDVFSLADHLQLGRFAVAGESGGGPRALALCHALPERITVALLLAGVGPMENPAALRGMHRANRMMFWLARHAPVLLHGALLLIRRGALRPQLRDDRRNRDKPSKQLTAMPAADRALYEQPQVRSLLKRAGAEALRQGVAPAVEDVVLLSRPWGFTLESIGVPVHLWQGSADRSVPPAMAQAMASTLPRSTLHLVEDAGHLVSFGVQVEIMGLIRQAAGAKEQG